MEHVDVLVIGGGPTGLTAAGDLARLGRSVTVLERWPSRNPASRAFATQARTLEVLDSRGLAEPLLAVGSATPGVRLWRGAGLDLHRLPTAFPFGLVTPQTNVDQALEGYAREHGATVLRGLQVVALDQDDDGVTVTAQHWAGPPNGPSAGPDDDPADAAPRTFRAAYVVAADGAHSTVRALLDVDFPGKSVLSSVVLADVRLAHPPDGTGLTLGSTRQVFGFLAPYGDGWYRSMTWDRGHQLPDTAPVEDGEISGVLNRAMGRDVGLQEISWRSRFHCDERQVAQYRHGRVFLAGDAAHVHSPVGGQGMNTGIQDAANLAWKLDLALSGAPDPVLDSYQSERHPIGRLVVFQSGAMMRSITLKPVVARAVRAVVGTALLKFPPFAGLVAGTFSGVRLRYGRTRGQHRLVGTRAAQVPLREGPLTALQRRPGFVLIRGRGAAPADTPLLQAERTDGGPALLVRPDGYVAWAGSSPADSRDGGWAAVLGRWTGAPARATAGRP